MRRILITILLIYSAALIPAQNFRGGLLAGMSATQVDGDTYGGYNRAGLVAGAWVSRQFSDFISVRSELKFIQKGSYRKLTNDDGLLEGSYSLRLSYAEMPFLVEYRYRENIIPFAGLSFGYLWKSKEMNNNYENPDDEDTAFRKLELAANAGVEYMINKKFSFCVSFSYSVLPIRKYKNSITYRWNTGQYNNVLQFYVRHHF